MDRMSECRGRQEAGSNRTHHGLPPFSPDTGQKKAGFCNPAWFTAAAQALPDCRSSAAYGQATSTSSSAKNEAVWLLSTAAMLRMVPLRSSQANSTSATDTV